MTGAPTAAVSRRRLRAAALAALVISAAAWSAPTVARADSAGPPAGVSLTADVPGTAVAPLTSGQPISDVVASEGAAGQLPIGVPLCLTMTSPSGASFDGDAPLPSVAATGGLIVTHLSVNASLRQVQWVLEGDPTSPSAGTPATLQFSGIRVTAGSNTGLVRASLDDCAGHPLSAPATLTGVVSVTRIGAPDPASTAVALVSTGPDGSAPFPTSHDVVVVSSASWPDAALASYLAGRLVRVPGIAPVLGVPILFVDQNDVPLATVGALSGLRADNVYIVGGPASVSPGVEATLRELPQGDDPSATLSVTRIGGIDRYATGVLVATRAGLGPIGTTGVSGADDNPVLPTAIVVSGTGFPDALAAAPMAFTGTLGNSINGNSMGFPMLLTDPNSLSSAARSGLVALGVRQVLIVGGTPSVSNAVAGQIADLGIVVRRLAGADREATAGVVATFERGVLAHGSVGVGLGWPIDAGPYLVRGDGFDDGAAAGPVIGVHHSSLLLTASPTELGPSTANWLVTNAGLATTATLVGDPVQPDGNVSSAVAISLAGGVG